jgi:hypothetical protein
MEPFQLTAELTNKPVAITAEQLDRLADEDGFIRFDVSCDERRSLIFVNVGNDLPLLTPEDAEAYFQALYYPEQVTGFSEEDIFSLEEVKTIAEAIRQCNRKLKTSSDLFTSKP